MKQDEIIQMAEQCGLPEFENNESQALSLVMFAKLVAAKEREACAKLVDDNAKACINNSMAQMVLYANATAIRARGITQV
jgi:hypothetical protein